MKLTAKDFERLTESQMQFKGIDWEVQITRFGDEPNFQHEYIYWVENSAALVLAIKYLEQEGFEYQANYDLKFDQPIITTNYAGSWLKV
jgi:hypothetical protein